MKGLSHSQILGLLPQSEEMIVRVHQRQQERYRQALEREKREAGKWGQNGIRAVRKPDGTHMKFRIPKLTYIMWQKKLGDECWDDAGFVHDFLRDNPQFRVTSIAENPTVGWTPGSVTAKRYRLLKQQQMGDGRSKMGNAGGKMGDADAKLLITRPTLKAPSANSQLLTSSAGGAQ